MFRPQEKKGGELERDEKGERVLRERRIERAIVDEATFVHTYWFSS